MDEPRKRFLTRAESGAILGGDSRPLSESTIRRLIAAGRIRVTADSRKLQRIIGASVYALADHLERGGSLWHGNPMATEAARSTKARKAQADGSRKSQMDMADTSESVPEARKTPRFTKLI